MELREMISKLRNRLSSSNKIKSGTVSKLEDRQTSSKTSDLQRVRKNRLNAKEYEDRYNAYNSAFDSYAKERDEYTETLKEWQDEDIRDKERKEYLAEYEKLKGNIKNLQSTTKNITGSQNKNLTEFNQDIFSEKQGLIDSENSIMEENRKRKQEITSNIYSQFNLNRSNEQLSDATQYDKEFDEQGKLVRITAKPKTYTQQSSQGGTKTGTYIPYIASFDSAGNIIKETVRGPTTSSSDYYRGSGNTINYGIIDKAIVSYKYGKPSNIITKDSYRTSSERSSTGGWSSNRYGDFVSSKYDFNNDEITKITEFQPFKSTFAAKGNQGGTSKGGIYLKKVTDYKKNLITDYNAPITQTSRSGYTPYSKNISTRNIDLSNFKTSAVSQNPDAKATANKYNSLVSSRRAKTQAELENKVRRRQTNDSNFFNNVVKNRDLSKASYYNKTTGTGWTQQNKQPKSMLMFSGFNLGANNDKKKKSLNSMPRKINAFGI